MTSEEQLKKRATEIIFEKTEEAVEARPGMILLIIGILVFLCFGSFLFTNILGWKFILGIFDTTPYVTVEDSRTIVSSVKPLGELVTINYQIATKDTALQLDKGYCGQTSKFAHIVEVQAGTDLTVIEESDWTFDETTQAYIITLPQPVLTNCGINDEIRYEDPRANVTCTNYDEDSYAISRYEVINRIREEVLRDGILDDAKSENEQTLTSFLGAISGKDVIIKYKNGESNHDLSCIPEKPNGWEYIVEDDGYAFWSPAS